MTDDKTRPELILNGCEAVFAKSVLDCVQTMTKTLALLQVPFDQGIPMIEGVLREVHRAAKTMCDEIAKAEEMSKP